MGSEVDTIFAPLTAKGKCSIYVIRISGILTGQCLEALGIRRGLGHREATLCNIRRDGEVIDEAVVTLFRAPNSFTGEDVAEIALHCSGFVISSVFSILNSLKGVRLAEPGEFSRRAFANGKMDLVQAESIADLIASETELQNRQAIRQLRGEMSKFYENLRAEMVEIMALLEAFIDFPEEDIPPEMQEEIGQKISLMRSKISSQIDSGTIAEKIQDGIRISIIGEPNAGKSSLLNVLARRDVAIVSDFAGTTRDIIQVNLDMGGAPVIVYDTAGIRNTEDFVEAEGVRRAIRSAESADFSILLVSAENPSVSDNLRGLVNEESIIVLNKIDILPTEKDLTEIINGLGNIFPHNLIITISVSDGRNISLLMEKLAEKVAAMTEGLGDSNVTNERHRSLLERALSHLEDFSLDKPMELAAEDVRLAANAIGRVTGSIGVDEVLDSIFSKFCIGK